MFETFLNWITGRKHTSHRSTVEGWTLFMGREAAELWLDALKARDTAKLSNA